MTGAPAGRPVPPDNSFPPLGPGLLVLPEAGCKGITLHESLSNPGELLLYEHWTDVETFLGPHSETPHLRSFIAKAGEFLAGPPEITLWRVIG